MAAILLIRSVGMAVRSSSCIVLHARRSAAHALVRASRKMTSFETITPSNQRELSRHLEESWREGCSLGKRQEEPSYTSTLVCVTRHITRQSKRAKTCDWKWWRKGGGVGSHLTHPSRHNQQNCTKYERRRVTMELPSALCYVWLSVIMTMDLVGVTWWIHPAVLSDGHVWSPWDKCPPARQEL